MNLFELIRPVTAIDICNILTSSTTCQIIGNENTKVSHFAPLTDASKNCISFVDSHSFKTTAKMVSAINQSSAQILIVPYIKLDSLLKHTQIVVDNPRKQFIYIVNTLGVSPKEYIFIGKQCNISDYAIIGGTGFGYIIDDIGLQPFPQIGYVSIEDFVTIQPFTAINRGSLGTTRIGKYTNINKFVNIGHNDNIGQYCIIHPHTCLCGSVTVGDNTWIGPGVTVKDHIKIGDRCVIGAGSVVVNNIPDGKIVKGNPAK